MNESALTAHVSFAERSLYVGNNIGTCLLDSRTRFESQSDPLLVFPCSHRAGPTGYVLVLSRLPSTRLVHFLPRAPDPRATHWAPPPPPPSPPPRVLSSLGLSLTWPSKPAVKSFRERRITTSSFPLASYRRALKAADVRG